MEIFVGIDFGVGFDKITPNPVFNEETLNSVIASTLKKELDKTQSIKSEICPYREIGKRIKWINSKHPHVMISFQLLNTNKELDTEEIQGISCIEKKENNFTKQLYDSLTTNKTGRGIQQKPYKILTETNADYSVIISYGCINNKEDFSNIVDNECWRQEIAKTITEFIEDWFGIEEIKEIDLTTEMFENLKKNGLVNEESNIDSPVTWKELINYELEKETKING